MAAANLSVFDRIVVLPAAAGPRAPVSASAQPPVFQQPQFNLPPPVPDDDGDDQRPVPNVSVPNQNRNPVFNTFPPQQAPQVVNPQFPGVVVQPPVQQMPSAFPTAPGGVAVPGMVAPAPVPQPGQVVQPTVPGQVRRPGEPGGR